MLVLARKPGEEIHVDGPATIRVEKKGRKILLCVTADLETKVLRGELAERLLHERRHDSQAIIGRMEEASADRLAREEAERCGRCGGCGLLLPAPKPLRCPECNGPLWQGEEFVGSP